MRVGSLFSGIGGIDLGLERAGMVVRWQVEIDDFASNILAKHWPYVARFRDVRHVGHYNLEPVDLIAGGFPCQDLSVAGKGAGIGGKRSGLWFQYLRIVRELRPAWVLVENVPALRTRGSDTVLDGLEQAGYAAWPLVVGARHVGAPHRRDRVWIIAFQSRLADLGQPGLEGLRPDAGEPEVAEPRDGGASELAHGHGHGRGRERIEEHGDEQSSSGFELDGRGAGGRWHWPARPGEPQHEWEEPRTTQSPLGRATDGLSRRLARHRRMSLTALGNSVVPQIVEAIGRAIMAVRR